MSVSHSTVSQKGPQRTQRRQQSEDTVRTPKREVIPAEEKVDQDALSRGNQAALSTAQEAPRPEHGRRRPLGAPMDMGGDDDEGGTEKDQAIGGFALQGQDEGAETPDGDPEAANAVEVETQTPSKAAETEGTSEEASCEEVAPLADGEEAEVAEAEGQGEEEAAAEGAQDESEDEVAAAGDEALDATEEAPSEPSTPAPSGEQAVSPAPVQDMGPRIVAEPASDPMIGDMWKSVFGVSPDEQAVANEAEISRLASVASGLQTEVVSYGMGLANAVGPTVDEQVAVIQAHLANCQAQVGQAFAQAHGQVDAAAGSALQAVDAAAQGALGALDAAQQAAMAQAATGYEGLTQQLAQVSATATQNLTAAFDGKVQEVRDLGSSVGGQATATGEQHASGYLGRGGGEDIEVERNEARAKAARAVAEEYRKGIVDRANQAADEIAKGRANLPSMVSQAAESVGQGLTSQRASMEQALSNAVQQVRTDIEGQRAAATTAVEQARTSAHAGLDQQQGQATGQLQSQAEQMEAQVRAAGEQGSQEIEGAANQVSSSFAAEVENIRAAVALSDLPNTDEMALAVDQAIAQLETDRDEMLASLDETRTAWADALAEQVSEGLTGMDQTASQACDAAFQAASQVETGFADMGVSFQGQMDTIAGNAQGSLTDMVTQSVDAARQSVDSLATSLAEQQNQVVSDLERARSGVQSQLSEALAKLPAAIGTEAEKAASKVQPTWKKVLSAVVSIIVAVVVFVVVAAFCVATLGMGLVVAGLIAGAIAGVVSLLAKDATMSLLTWSNQMSSWQEYVKAAIVGGVCGAVGAGVGGAAWGIVAKSLVTGFTAGAIDQVTDVALLGQNFNLGEFITITVVSALTFGLYEKFAKGRVTDLVKSTFLPGPNSWNTFQRKVAQVLPGLSSSERAALYKQFTDKIPNKLVGKMIDKVYEFAGITKDPDQTPPDGPSFDKPLPSVKTGP